MRTRPPRTVRFTCVLLGLPVLLAVAGCRSPGGLEDAGAARPVRAHPSAQPLWPSTVAAAPPVSTYGINALARANPLVPLPGLAFDTLAGADARTVLAADPALTPDERAVLDGGCTGCEVRPAQYRDLDGDGGPELLTAVLSATGPDGPRAVLHVYALRGRQVLPVLAAPAPPTFTAETVGTDLLVRDPGAPFTETVRTYRWSGDRLALADQRIKVLGAPGDTPGCLATAVCEPTTSLVVVAPTTGPVPTPTAAPAPTPAAGPEADPAGTTAVRPTPTRTR
ncbi:MBL fold metallo-hydrolase [Kitasatospora phosalacinea]|uniref:Lipoprotein n=1 Tax=Kitasatospora phosalacinea TaxID=2065 RepID=A0A9W6PMT3_9ACTN|nr:MBL fold metallo-hydrolase [Kitasatospora phosalacinea]GLW57739.1 hypothetical protein Kpho01_57500 [Kitasatospora phosalacinea]